MATVPHVKSSHNLVTTTLMFVVLQILLSTNGQHTVKEVKEAISYIEKYITIIQIFRRPLEVRA